MSKSQHTETQKKEAFQQLKAGRSTEEVGRQYGVSRYTLYAWRAKYDRLEGGLRQEVQQLRRENARLKRLVATLRQHEDPLS